MLHGLSSLTGVHGKDPELASDVNRMMARVVRTVKEWPEDDLFKRSLPVPLVVESN